MQSLLTGKQQIGIGVARLMELGWCRGGVALLVGLLLLPAGIYAQRAGDLDTSFGSGGHVITDILGGSSASAVALQPDSKIVVVGHRHTTSEEYELILLRYRSNGSLDPTFGGNGQVTTNLGSLAADVKLQSDGKIVVAGKLFPLWPDETEYFVLMRYLSNGTLDPMFGSGGRVIDDFGSIASDIALQPDGKIVVVIGDEHGVTGLARYHSNGTLDPTFGSGGRVATDFGGHSNGLSAIVLQPDGKIVVVGYTLIDGNGGDFALARYLPNGALDPTFGSGGQVTTDFGGNEWISDAVLQPDGKIVVYGSTDFTDDDVTLARYLPNGALDPTFGSGGQVITDFWDYDIPHAMALQPDGRIVVSYATHRLPTNDPDFALGRYLPDGTLDPMFGSGGQVTTDFRGEDAAYALFMQPHDGRVVAVGRTHYPSAVALARYHAITCSGVVVTRVGTAGNDTIVGTSGPDVIHGFRGNDIIVGLGGHDILCGGNGNDTLRGSGGDDLLRGGPGEDFCNGGAGSRDQAVECERVLNVP